MAATSPWMPLALGELGIHETPGPAATSRIVEYHSMTSLAASSDEIPWCSAFVNWVLARSGFRTSRSASAKSWIDVGTPTDPRYGAVVVFDRGTNPVFGHVGFYLDDDGTVVWVLGGNQANAVCVRSYLASKVCAIRWPVRITGKVSV